MKSMTKEYAAPTIRQYLLTLLLLISTIVFGQNKDTLNSKELMQLSFEQLMNVEVNIGTYTGIEESKIPVSITEISSQQIQSTPARNLLDLLEVYVPGFTFVNHWLGPRIGMRGVSGDQNTSYVLLVNGENHNMQTQNGPIFEIQNRDLNDIERIEIIHGPGSVTYGTGAIGGIINIITKNAESEEGFNVNVESNALYRYNTASLSYGVKQGDMSVYLYGSLSSSEGISDPEFYYVDRAHGYGYGYMGNDWGNKGLGTPAPNFYEDFWDKPQGKIQLDIQLPRNLSLQSRFTSFSFTKQAQAGNVEDGTKNSGLYGKQFSTYLNKEHHFSDKLRFTSIFGFQSLSSRTVTFYQGTNQVFDHITQRHNSFSENTWLAKGMFNLTPARFLDIAFGVEYRYFYLGPEWGMDESSFIMPFQAPIRFAIQDTSSGFYQTYNSSGFTTYIEDRIDASLFSTFVEGKIEATKDLTFLLSARIDKHTYAELGLSPRIATIFTLDSKNTIKLIGQHSVRLPAFTDLYSEDYLDEGPTETEVLRGLELIFSRLQKSNLMFTLSSYYTSIDQLAWTFDEHSDFVGTFNVVGFDAEVNYKTDKVNAGASYSFVHQLKWDPETEIIAYLSNIGVDSIDVYFEDYGENRLNNIPRNTFKAFVNYQPIENFNLHADGRFMFGFGQLDMLEKFKEIHDELGTEATRTEMQYIYNDLLDKGYTKPSFTSNVQVDYKIPVGESEIKLSVYAMNLFAFNHVRYVFQYWEHDDSRQYPRQCGFVNEPLSIGFKLNASL